MLKIKIGYDVISTMDDYINAFTPGTRKKLIELRNLIQKIIPEAEETFRYGIPTYRMQNKNLVHFAAFKKHIGFYPTPSGIAEFKKELAGYKTSKGAVQFPINQPLPVDLIRRIVTFRVRELK